MSEKRYLTWQEVDALCQRLADQLRGQKFDLFLAISRGGLIPAGLLAKRLKHFHVLVASVMYYDERDQRLEHPVLLEFPAEPVLHGKTVLIVDDVWDSGQTIAFIEKIVVRAGGQPKVATLHFKPQRSEVDGHPDFYAEETQAWIVYPWESNDLDPCA